MLSALPGVCLELTLPTTGPGVHEYCTCSGQGNTMVNTEAASICSTLSSTKEDNDGRHIWLVTGELRAGPDCRDLILHV